LDALHTLVEAGIPAGVLLAPVLPAITDRLDQLSAVVEAAKAHGASSLWTNALHLGDVTRQSFFEYLEHRRPELVAQYNKLYRGKYAPSEYRRRIQEVVAALKSRSGFGAGSDYARRVPPKLRSVPEQLFLL
jgi:DNA repair photolyase